MRRDPRFDRPGEFWESCIEGVETAFIFKDSQGVGINQCVGFNPSHPHALVQRLLPKPQQ